MTTLKLSMLNGRGSKSLRYSLLYVDQARYQGYEERWEKCAIARTGVRKRGDWKGSSQDGSPANLPEVEWRQFQRCVRVADRFLLPQVHHGSRNRSATLTHR